MLSGPWPGVRPAALGSAGLAIATRQDGGDPLRSAWAELAIATGQDGGDPLRSAWAELAIATGGNLDYSSCVYRKDLADDGR